MKKKFLLSTVTALALLSNPLFADESSDVDEIWEVLDKVETHAMRDNLQLNFELRTRVDEFRYKNNGIGTRLGIQAPSGTGHPADREYAFPQEKIWEPQYSVRGFLHMKAKTGDNLKFTGRIRIDHNSQGDQRICILSPQNIGSELPSSSTVVPTSFDIDRAYFDWSLKNSFIPITLSAGILPTSGGLSSNIIENTPRRSVFPSMIFDSNVYGAIATFKIPDFLGLKNSYIRAIAGESYTLNSDAFFYQCNRETIQNMDVAGVFAETSLPIGAENIFWAGVNANSNIKAIPFLGGEGAENSDSNTKIKTAQPLGDIINAGAGLQVKNVSVAGGKLDFFVHYAISNPNPNGNCVNYTDQNLTSTDCTNGVGAIANPSPYYTSEMARGTLLTDAGHSVYTGLRYAIGGIQTKVGYEYNKGSAYWWSATQGSEDVFNKLATRGEVNEVYIIQPLTKGLFARLGYLRIQEQYTGSGWHFGTPLVKDAVQQNIYLLLNAYF